MSETHVVLMSGGLDSSTVAALARASGVRVQPLLIRYGQRHAVELSRAHEIAEALGCLKPVVMSIDLRSLGGSSLTDNIDIPKDRPRSDMARGTSSTYVPCRNLIMLSLASSLAERIRADAVAIGINAMVVLRPAI